MRVLVVTTWYPSDAAVESGLFVQRDVRLLAREHDVVVLHLVAPRLQASAERVVAEGIPVIRFPMSTSSPIDIVRASRLIRRMLPDFDLVHTMALSSLLPTSLVSVGRPWLHTEHWSGIVSPETIPLAMRLTLPLSTRLLRKPDVVVAVSDYLAEHIRARRDGPVSVIPNFVMSPDAVTAPPEDDSVLELVAVGGLIPRKGPDIALAAVSELHKRGIDAHLTWIGDGPMRTELEAAVIRGALESSVTFAGVRPPSFVAESLAQADIFLLPTMNETFGVSIAEALAGGRPVVVGSVGGQAEYVSPANGELVSRRDGVSYADAIERVRAAALSPEQIRATVAKRFSEEQRAAAYAAVYPAVSDNEPDVDVVIAVHDERRQIERAVASVLDHNKRSVRVSVVCHDIPAERVAARLTGHLADARLRILEFADGVLGPAGPFNAGLAASTARFTSVMGSDDELEPGAIDHWVDLAEREAADVVIARLRKARAGAVPTPPTRPGRSRRLDGVRDRLSYRSAPLGLVSRERFGDVRFTSGVPTGEDVAYVSRLWFSGARISYARTGPAYVVHDDAPQRASFAARPLSDDLAFLELLLNDRWLLDSHDSIRRALATKVWRIHMFGAIYRRRDTGFSRTDRQELARIGRELLAFCPDGLRALSIADRRLIDVALDPSAPDMLLINLSVARLRRAHVSSIFTRNPFALLAREAVLRMGFATVLQQR